MQTGPVDDCTLLIGHQTSNHIVVVIGAGVGGPQALAVILDELPYDFPGTVLVIANKDKGFTNVLADKLSYTSQMPVSVIKNGQVLRPCEVLFIPSGCIVNIVLNEDDRNTHVISMDCLDNFPGEDQQLDILMNSAATMFCNHAIGVVLTGVGNDGLIGSRSIRDAGGIVLAQDEASSVCYGAPGAVSAAGLANQDAPPWQIGSLISSYAMREITSDAA